MANKVVVRDRACKQCGISPITGYKYCSERCANNAHYRVRPKGERYRQQIRDAHKAFLDRRYGPKANGLKRRKRIDPHPCEVCGKITQRPKCCSVKCLAKTEQAKETQHRSSSRRRAQIKGAWVERVDRLRVFERDGWKCHLCGKPTKRDRLGTNHRLAPELDHIVPLNKGGAHSYANTACAHKSCNAAKQDRVIGQPSLLAA